MIKPLRNKYVGIEQTSRAVLTCFEGGNQTVDNVILCHYVIIIISRGKSPKMINIDMQLNGFYDLDEML